MGILLTLAIWVAQISFIFLGFILAVGAICIVVAIFLHLWSNAFHPKS